MKCLDNKIRDIVKVDRSLACNLDWDGTLTYWDENVMYEKLKSVVNLKK